MDGFLFYWGGVLHLCIWSIIYDQTVFLFPLPLECEGACSRISHFPEKKSAWLQVMYSTFFNLIHESPYPDMGALKLAPTIFGSEVVASRKFNTGKIDYHLRRGNSRYETQTPAALLEVSL